MKTRKLSQKAIRAMFDREIKRLTLKDLIKEAFKLGAGFDEYQLHQLSIKIFELLEVYPKPKQEGGKR